MFFSDLSTGDCKHLAFCAKETRCNLGTLACHIEYQLLDDAKAMLMKLRDTHKSDLHLAKSPGAAFSHEGEKIRRYLPQVAMVKNTLTEVGGEARELEWQLKKRIGELEDLMMPGKFVRDEELEVMHWVMYGKLEDLKTKAAIWWWYAEPEVRRLDVWLQRVWWWFFHGKEEMGDVGRFEWCKEDEDRIAAWDLELRKSRRKKRETELAEATRAGTLPVADGTCASAGCC